MEFLVPEDHPPLALVVGFLSGGPGPLAGPVLAPLRVASRLHRESCTGRHVCPGTACVCRP